MDRSNTVPTAITFIIFIALCIGGFFLVRNLVDTDQEQAHSDAIKEIGELPNINVNINGTAYTAETLVSYASQNFISYLAITVEMDDLGSNQKKGCPYIKFEGDTPRVKKIERGDVLVYADSCIIIATDSFSNNGKYKKIAHINNLADIPTGKQTVVFSKAQ